MIIEDLQLRCSFCDRSQDRVGKLITGGKVNICDKCIGLCNNLLEEKFLNNDDSEQFNSEPDTSFSLAKLPKPKDLKQHLVESSPNQKQREHHHLRDRVP